MTSFKIDSIVQNDGNIVIPTPSFMPGTTVHVVVTADERTEEKYSVEDLTDSLDGVLALGPLPSNTPIDPVDLAMREADRRYADTFRRLAE